MRRLRTVVRSLGHVKRTGSAQAAGDPGGSKPRTSPSQSYTYSPTFRRGRGETVAVWCLYAMTKTSRSGCQSSTDGVACRLSGFLEALTFSRPCCEPAGVRSHGFRERGPRPDLDRPKSEFAASLSAANPLYGRHNGNTPSDESPAICPGSTAILAIQPHPYGGKCPWFY